MSRKKTVVTGINEKMNDDKFFKYSYQEATSKWIWDNSGKLDVSFKDEDLSDYVLDYSQRTLFRQFNRLYNWSKKPNKYFYGLPKSSLIFEPEKVIIPKTQEYIKTLHTEEPIFINTFISDRDFYFTIWLTLVSQYGYDSQTNELTKLSQEKGYTCYLYDGVLTLSERTIQEYEDIGLNTTTLALSYGKCFDREKDITTKQTPHIQGDDDKCTITYKHENGSDIFDIDLSFVNPVLQDGQELLPEYEYVYATYTINDTYYWFGYALDSGGIIQIDTQFKGKNLIGEFYPRLYTRINQQDVIDLDNKEAVKDTKLLFKRIGLDLNTVTKQFHKSIGDEYDAVRGMFVFAGVRVNEAMNDSSLAEYCFRYFHRIHELSDKVKTDNDKVIRCVGGVNEIKDNVSVQKFSYDYIDVEEIQGKLIDVNKFIAGKDTHIQTKSRGGISGLLGKKRTSISTELYLIQQISNDKYIKITVKNLQQYTYISGYGFNKTLLDNDLVLPLDRTLITHLTNKEKEVLFYKGLSVCILHAKVVKKKWYQTTLFKVLMVVVVAVITFVVPPAGAGLGATMTALLKAGAIALLKGLALSFALNTAIQLLVKAGIISPKLGVILQAVATIVALAYGGGTFDFSNLLTAPNLMSAINTSFNAYQKLETAKMQDALRQLNQLNQDRSNRLQEAQKLLDTKVFNTNQELLRSNFLPTVNLFETPEMFYARHYGFNVIDVSHELIHNYVQGTLEYKKIYQHRNQDVEDVLLLI